MAVAWPFPHLIPSWAGSFKWTVGLTHPIGSVIGLTPLGQVFGAWPPDSQQRTQDLAIGPSLDGFRVCAET